MSAASKLRKQLSRVVDGLAELIETLPVHRIEREDGDLVFAGGPEHYWGKLSHNQSARQLALKRQYEPISELLVLLLRQAPNSLMERLRDANVSFRVWLELDGYNWSVSPNADQNVKEMRKVAEQLEQILSVLDVTGKGEVILVPDTNSLLNTADPTQYRKVAANDSFTFMLLPSVLGELDRLKIEHRNPDIREKAKKIISRIKGWRLQGSLSDGVTVDKSITVKASHSEPDMENTLSWLRADNQDDRIVASVLALQAQEPTAHVVLVTGDINLLNKADAALIDTAEI
jgi:hypothetical protein